MDFASVAGLTIPAGSVNKISIGGVVIWVKSSGNKYKILKNGVEVANVTMSQFVKAVQSGAAQEDWGIGAQIVIPYHDPWDEKTYQLPFNFGTFTAYGEGKLGLQAHYSVPSANTKLMYGKSKDGDFYKYCGWGSSYIYKWLNAYGSEHELTDTRGANGYTDKTGFLGCLPDDFVNVMNLTYHSSGYTYNEEGVYNNFGISSKIFLPSTTNVYASTGKINGSSGWPVYTMNGDGEDTAWEYWVNRMGRIQYNSMQAVSERVSYNINNPQETKKKIMLPNKVYVNSANPAYQAHACFDTSGKYEVTGSTDITCYLPACVIG